MDQLTVKKPKGRVNPPYDTGKVKIGWAYTPRPPLYNDRDADRLQTALLNTTPRKAGGR